MRHLTGTVLIALLAACGGASGADTYTLVRNGASDDHPRAEGPPLRIHVATFDASEGASYNAENCEVARRLFQGQPGVTARFQCEKGGFRK